MVQYLHFRILKFPSIPVSRYPDQLPEAGALKSLQRLAAQQVAAQHAIGALPGVVNYRWMLGKSCTKWMVKNMLHTLW